MWTIQQQLCETACCTKFFFVRNWAFGFLVSFYLNFHFKQSLLSVRKSSNQTFQNCCREKTDGKRWEFHLTIKRCNCLWRRLLRRWRCRISQPAGIRRGVCSTREAARPSTAGEPSSVPSRGSASPGAFVVHFIVIILPHPTLTFTCACTAVLVAAIHQSATVEVQILTRAIHVPQSALFMLSHPYQVS